MVNAWVVGIAGIWLVFAPFVSMSSTGNVWNDWVVGFVTAILGFTLSGEGWRRYVAGFAGLWLLASGFVPALRMGSGLYANDLIIGGLLVIAGFAAASHRHHIGMQEPQHIAH